MRDDHGAAPPTLTRFLFKLLLRGDGEETIWGDVEEGFQKRTAEKGVFYARWWYRRQALASVWALWMASLRQHGTDRSRTGPRAQRGELGTPRLGGGGRWGGVGISWLDVKLGLRMLVKYPGLTLVAVFALSIGIPVGLAPWHVINAIEGPLPVDEGDRIQGLRYLNLATSSHEATTSYEFRWWREELTTFEALGASRASAHNVSEGGLAAPVSSAEVTASTFDILRVIPLHGRTLTSADEVIGAPDVVVIGHDLWRSRLGGEPAIVGRAIRVGGILHTVVGVMPEEFRFPTTQQLWLPLRDRATDEPRQGRALTIFGRLSDAASQEEAQTELTAVGSRMAIEFPNTYALLQPEVVPFAYMAYQIPRGGLGAMPQVYLIQMLALLLLVVACANVGMLIFARTATRSAELSMRTALGASRARIISQVFTESLALAVLAAGVGLLLTDWLPNRLVAVIREVPYGMDLGVTPETVFWALSLAVFSAVVAGIVPALRITGRAVQRNMQRAAAARSGIRFGGMSSALIVVDVAIAVAVVGPAAGQLDMLRVAGAQDVVGIEAEQFLAVELTIPQIEPASDRTEVTERVGATQLALVQRLKAEPGVRSVAVGSVLPRMDHLSRMIEVDREVSADELRTFWVRTASVDVDFFDALDQPILSGRGFDAGDLGEDRSAVIVNTNFVDGVLGGRNPIGRRVRYTTSADEEPGPWFEVVGVVGHLGMRVTDPDNDRGLYHPVAPGEINPVQLAIHVGDDPESFTPRVRTLANEIDPTAFIAAPTALDEVWGAQWYKWAAGTLAGEILVGILLALAACGIYAMMSFTVAERTREIGIRVALGAQRPSIAFMVARRALAQLGVGVLVGMPIARWLGDGLRNSGPTSSSLLFALVPGVCVVVLIGVLACTAPTLRALRIMPTEALRSGG